MIKRSNNYFINHFYFHIFLKLSNEIELPFVVEMIWICLELFRISGFYPVNEDPRKSIFTFLWTFLNFCFVLSLILYVGIFHDEVLYALTPIGNINDVLVCFSLFIAHLVIIIESFLKRKYFLTFWENYKKVLAIGKQKNTIKWQKNLMTKIIIFTLISITSELLVITNIQTDHQWIIFWSYTVFSLLMTRTRHLQNIFFIDVIFFMLEDLNLNLKNSTDCNSRSVILQTLSDSKKQFKHLVKMIICVNKIFGASQVLNFGQNFIEVTSELYWIYVFASGNNFLWRERKLNEN